MFQQGVVHIAFGSVNQHYALLISAVEYVLAGMVTVKVPLHVLSEPKSITATDALLALAL